MDLLVEDAELVANAIADGWTLQGRQRIQIAGSQPAETAVAQSGLLFAGEDGVEILAEFRHRRARCLLDVEVEQVIPQMGAQQEFRRQIAGNLAIEIEIGLGGVHPAVLHAVAYCQCQGAVVVVRTGDRRQAPNRIAQMVGHGLPEVLRVQAGSCIGWRGSGWGWGSTTTVHDGCSLI